MTRIASHNSRHDPAVYPSLGLNALLGSMLTDCKYSILDLGPALGVNVDFWSRVNCRLHIEDFFHSYTERRSPDTDNSTESILAGLFPFDDQTRFDVILAWDLFNYLDLEELDALIGRLIRWCRPGTQLFALISSLHTIPAEPTQFRIVDSEHILYHTTSRETRPCPRHQPRDIARLMARFEVSSSFLLRHGMQEYLFSFTEGVRR